MQRSTRSLISLVRIVTRMTIMLASFARSFAQSLAHSLINRVMNRRTHPLDRDSRTYLASFIAKRQMHPHPVTTLCHHPLTPLPPPNPSPPPLPHHHPHTPSLSPISVTAPYPSPPPPIPSPPSQPRHSSLPTRSVRSKTGV